jgi:Protein of unknown function (DUF3631)
MGLAGYAAREVARSAIRAQARPAPARHPGTVAVPQRATIATTPGGPPIDGQRVLNQAYGWLGHMARWPSPWAQITATLYAGAANAKDPTTGLPVWTYMPRLFYTSKEGGSGKSWMSRLTAALCPDPERLAEMTKASMIDLIAEHHTVIVTELDVFVGTGKRNQWLTGIANVGYEFDGKTSRKHAGKVQKIPLFGPMVLDGLDSVIHATGVDLKTLMSRCIIVHVNRAPDGYRAPRYDREMRAFADRLGQRMARWMAQQVDQGIGDTAPQLPDGLGNRPADLWEPLISVADAAGGPWPELARAACTQIESAAGLPGEDEADDEAIEDQLDKWGAQAPQIDPVAPDPDPDPADWRAAEMAEALNADAADNHSTQIWED